MLNVTKVIFDGRKNIREDDNGIQIVLIIMGFNFGASSKVGHFPFVNLHRRPGKIYCLEKSMLARD
jgi:hypothetical protein